MCKRTCFIDYPNVRTFHSLFFHGASDRDGIEQPCPPFVWASTPNPSPLQVMRSGLVVPPVTLPGDCLVVTHKIATQLNAVSGIRIRDVVIRKAVDYYIAKGDKSWVQHWGQQDPYKVLRSLPNSPRLYSEMPRLFELQLMRLDDIIANFPDAPRISINVASLEQTVVIRLSTAVLQQYSILSESGVAIMSEVAFSIFAPHLDSDFFVIQQFEI